MDETVKRLSSHPASVFRYSVIQISLAKKEEINIQKKGVTDKGEHFVRDWVIVTL